MAERVGPGANLLWPPVRRDSAVETKSGTPRAKRFLAATVVHELIPLIHAGRQKYWNAVS